MRFIFCVTVRKKLITVNWYGEEISYGKKRDEKKNSI